MTRALACAVVLLGWGCAAGPEEHLGRSSAALYGTAPDLDSPTSNVVVRFGDFPGCSGILLTPRIVLTANHCVYGSKQPALGPACGAQSAIVQLGCIGATPRLRVLTTLTMVGDCQTSERVGDDIALLFLEKAVVRSEVPRSQPIPIVRRPSFRSDGGQGIGVAGYSPLAEDGTYLDGAGLRRARLLGSSDILRHDACLPELGCPRGAYWSLTTSALASLATWGLRAGDSGGPLYVMRDGVRDPIGVASATTGNPVNEIAWFSDITTPAVRDWILANVREGTSPLGHSRAWLARHGKTADDWWGEHDSTGECDPDHDRDCDGWTDAHDDCPTIADSDQLDGDDDGMGDACDPCPHGGGGPSCVGSEILRTSGGSGSPSGG